MKKKFTAILAVLLLLVLTLTLGAAPVWASELPKVVDEANLLTDSEEHELEAKLQNLGDSYGLDIVAVTVSSAGGADHIQKFTEQFYDQNGYGYDAEGSGVILLIAIDDSAYYIDRVGAGVDMITDNDLADIEDGVLPYLEIGDFYGAFGKFAEMTADDCEAYINYGPTDPSYPPGPEPHPEKEDYPLAANLGISGALGALVSAIATGRNKSKLRSVRSRNQAGDYVRDGSLALRDNRDLFLYSQVSRIPRPKQNGQDAMAAGAAGGAMMGGHRPSGGSSFHTTSNGRRHGGKGGRF